MKADYDDAAELVRRGGEEVVTLLKVRPRRLLVQPRRHDGKAMGRDISALELLGAIGSITGLDAALYALYERTEELGDFLTEDMPSILASFGDRALPGLEECTLDRTRRKNGFLVKDAYVRTIAMIARKEPSLRREILEFLRSLIGRKSESKELMAATIWVTAELKDESALPIIREAYRTNRVEKHLISLDDVQEIYASKDESDFEYHLDEWNPLDYFKRENLDHLMEAQRDWLASAGADQMDEDEGVNKAAKFSEIQEEGDALLNKKPSSRNEPCICGSGKKYKKCCLPLQQERRLWEPLETRVRALVEEFVHDERWNEELDRASSLFGINKDGSDRAGRRLFFDWYIHDYVVARSGQSLIKLLENDMRVKRADDETTMRTISSWAASTFRFLEVLELRRGAGYMVKDIFRGSEYFIWDVSSSHNLSRYDILCVRPYAVGRIVRTTGG